MHTLDLGAVARSFGFATPPKVNLNIESRKAHVRKAQKKQGADYRRQATGHKFSAANPLGERESGDTR